MGILLLLVFFATYNERPFLADLTYVMPATALVMCCSLWSRGLLHEHIADALDWDCIDHQRVGICLRGAGADGASSYAFHTEPTGLRRIQVNAGLHQKPHFSQRTREMGTGGAEV